MLANLNPAKTTRLQLRASKEAFHATPTTGSSAFSPNQLSVEPKSAYRMTVVRTASPPSTFHKRTRITSKQTRNLNRARIQWSSQGRKKKFPLGAHWIRLVIRNPCRSVRQITNALGEINIHLMATSVLIRGRVSRKLTKGSLSSNDRKKRSRNSRVRINLRLLWGTIQRQHLMISWISCFNLQSLICLKVMQRNFRCNS